MSFVQRIALALLFAVTISIFPVPEIIAPLRPQFVLLIFLYLQLFANAYFYVSLLLFVCLLLDVMHANVLGQNALPVLLTCLVMFKRSMRFQFFPEPQQFLIIFFLVLLNNSLFALIGWLFSNTIAWTPLFLGALSSAACWPLVHLYFGPKRIMA
jgi:rod shape-determining protein MreD